MTLKVVRICGPLFLGDRSWARAGPFHLGGGAVGQVGSNVLTLFLSPQATEADWGWENAVSLNQLLTDILKIVS